MEVRWCAWYWLLDFWEVQWSFWQNFNFLLLLLLVGFFKAKNVFEIMYSFNLVFFSSWVPLGNPSPPQQTQWLTIASGWSFPSTRNVNIRWTKHCYKNKQKANFNKQYYDLLNVSVLHLVISWNVASILTLCYVHTGFGNPSKCTEICALGFPFQNSFVHVSLHKILSCFSSTLHFECLQILFSWKHKHLHFLWYEVM